MITYPVVLYWIALVACMVARGPAMLYLFFASWSFGAFAAIPPEMLGGINLTPAWITAGFLILKVVLQEGPGELTRVMLDPRRVGLLTLCAIYGMVSAFVFPRLFAGVIDVIPMKLTFNHSPQPLEPTSQNFTQTFYFVMTVVAVGVFYLISRVPDGRSRILNALLFGGCVAGVTGVLDQIAPSVGLSTVLAPFRSATYSLLTDASAFAGSGRRVVGLMPEASAFAGMCVAFLAPLLLFREAYRTKFTRNILVPSVGILLLYVIWQSVSSTGIVGVAVLGAVFALHSARSVALKRRHGLSGFVVLYAVPIVVLAVCVLLPSLTSTMLHTIDVMVFQKSSSDSYIERSMWTQVTFDAFVHSGGLGVGLGSARASSWPVAVLGNLGAPGAVLTGLFLFRLMTARAASGTTEDDIQLIAAKYALYPDFAMIAIVGTTVNFGLGASWLFGFIIAIAGPEVAPVARRTVNRLPGLTKAPPVRAARTAPGPSRP